MLLIVVCIEEILSKLSFGCLTFDVGWKQKMWSKPDYAFGDDMCGRLVVRLSPNNILIALALSQPTIHEIISYGNTTKILDNI
jgi:hypothetical protein